MRYLIIPNGSEPFYTDWYDYENNYVDGMIVFKMYNNTYSTDGETFIPIPIDHL